MRYSINLFIFELITILHTLFVSMLGKAMTSLQVVKINLNMFIVLSIDNEQLIS